MHYVINLLELQQHSFSLFAAQLRFDRHFDSDLLGRDALDWLDHNGGFEVCSDIDYHEYNMTWDAEVPIHA